jgi:ATP-dependent Clp protease ATP-binding subunit ClpA
VFDRYTEKARRVIFFARLEASEFGSPEISSEFLLLGLLRESKYVITRWLGDRDWQTILRDEIAKRVYTGSKISTSVDLPLTNDAKCVLAYAAEEAQRLGHQHIGTEHLFLGLLREPESYVGKMLHNFGVNIHTVRETLAREGAQHGISSFGSGFGSGSDSGRHTAALRTFQVVILIEGVSEPLQVQWPARIPAVGEMLSLESGIYRIANVEWTVDKAAGRPTSLSKVVISVQRFDAING